MYVSIKEAEKVKKKKCTYLQNSVIKHCDYVTIYQHAHFSN